MDKFTTGFCLYLYKVKPIEKDMTMKIILEKLQTIIKYILFIIYFIFEEFVIKMAKRLLTFIRQFDIYGKFIDFINRSNDLILLSSFLFIAGIAETSATFAVFLSVRGFVKLGIFFYILKIIIYIPTVDIFKHNKKRLLKYRIIKTLYYWYLLIISSKIYRNIKKVFKDIKEKIKAFFYPIRKTFLSFVKFRG